MAKRLSSIFSLGSNNSEASSHSSKSRPRSVFTADQVPADHLPSALLTSPRSTPDLRPSTLSSRFQDAQLLQYARRAPPGDPSRLSPHVGPVISSALPSLDEDDGLLAPPFPRKPLPQQTGSPDGSRPVSRSSRPGSRAPSRDGMAPHSRTSSPTKLRLATPTGEQSRLSKRRSWLPGSRGRPEADSAGIDGASGNAAWILTPVTQDKLHYDLTPMINFQKIPELWNDACDTYVYLHAQECGRGPSFKIDSSLFASSRKLASAAYGGLPNTNDLSNTDSRHVSQDAQHRRLIDAASNLRLNPPGSPPTSQRGSSNRSSSIGDRSRRDYFEDSQSQKQEISLCTPLPLHANLADPNARLSDTDIDVIVAMRNMFAMLAGQPLVATPKHPSIFSIFLEIANVLHRYEFTNFDGSNLGEEVAVAFGHNVIDFRLADVRYSREKTIEAIVLGERMKYWPLYNEGFVHAVGKYDSLVRPKSLVYHYITEVARERMERANLELFNRLRNVRGRLEDFDFPSMWAGIANSKTSSDSKGIRFKVWRSAFSDMRGHVMSLYKERYGAWPPRARSKKNDFEESGLNRLLLRELYTDFSDLYDALVDRTSPTTRHIEIPSGDHPEDAEQEPTPRALRRILSEYDRSIPPVQPPMPFDTPRFPSLTTTRADFASLDLKKQRKESTKKLSTSEINLALLKSYNREHGQDPVKSTPFIDFFTAFERRCARGKSIEEIIDIRVGQWIFLYAVLQALPLVVVDAPDLKFTQGVEYFLCEVPKGNPPWVQENYPQKQSWYGITGGSGMVSLPADVVEHGVDGIYRRSHCWAVAERWAGSSAVFGQDDESVDLASYYQNPNPSIHQATNESRLHESPRIAFTAEELQVPFMPGSRPESRSSSVSPSRRGHSMALGLEQLPLPHGINPTGSRPTSAFNPDMSFDKILAAGAAPSSGKKTKKK